MPFNEIVKALARPYPHGFVDPLRTKGEFTRLAKGLSKGEMRAREIGADPREWQAMLGVMNIHLARPEHPLGKQMRLREMLDDMVGIRSGKGNIPIKEALKAWSRTR